jgi:two-component system LytT family response regulator
MLTVLIVDDEPAARSRMLELLSGDRHIAVVGEVGSVFAAKEFLAKQVPDVIFLDIEMPNGNGFDLLSSVSDATQVVFVTAWDKYAVQAFAMAAADYLVKPVDPERLRDTLERLHNQSSLLTYRRRKSSQECSDYDMLDFDPSPQQYRLESTISVPFKDKKSNAILKIADICWIESLRNYTKVALSNQSCELIFRRRLTTWEESLPRELFPRLGRSYILQVSRIEQVEWNSRTETIVYFRDEGLPLSLGRLPASRLREILGQS